jgi:hypothetical protein
MKLTILTIVDVGEGTSRLLQAGHAKAVGRAMGTVPGNLTGYCTYFRSTVADDGSLVTRRRHTTVRIVDVVKR